MGEVSRIAGSRIGGLRKRGSEERDSVKRNSSMTKFQPLSWGIRVGRERVTAVA